MRTRCLQYLEWGPNLLSDGSVFWELLANIGRNMCFSGTVSISCLANLRSGSGFLQCRNERLDTEELHKTVFSLKCEFKWFQHQFWWFVIFLCLIVWFLLSWRKARDLICSRDGPSERLWSAADARETSSSKWEHMLASTLGVSHIWRRWGVVDYNTWTLTRLVRSRFWITILGVSHIYRGPDVLWITTRGVSRI